MKKKKLYPESLFQIKTKVGLEHLTFEQFEQILKGKFGHIFEKGFFNNIVIVRSDKQEEPHLCVEQIKNQIEVFQNNEIALSKTAIPYTETQLQFEKAGTNLTNFQKWLLNDVWKNYGLSSPNQLNYLSTKFIYWNELFNNTNFLLFAIDFINKYIPLFIAVSANSLLQSSSGDYLSSRVIKYPNIDVPSFLYPSMPPKVNYTHLLKWFDYLQDIGLKNPDHEGIFTINAIPNMLGYEIDGIVLNAIDGGTNVPYETILGCCTLLENLVLEAHKHFQEERYTFSPQMNRINQIETAKLGFNAKIFYNGETVLLRVLANHIFQNIPNLLPLIKQGSPAKQEQMNQQQNNL